MIFNLFLIKLKKFILLFLYLILFPLNLFLVLIIRLLRPIVLIRYAYIKSTRIGHFIENVDFYLCAKKEGLFLPRQKYIDIFYLNSYVCNKQIEKLWRRKIIIFPRVIMHSIDKINRFFDLFFDSEDVHTIGRYKKLRTPTPMPPWLNRDIYSFYNKYLPQFEFTKRELDYGFTRIEEMGIKRNDKYICLYVRDKNYLIKKYPNNDWSYHDYRNLDINTFLPAAEFLAEKGYKVVRIGTLVEKKLESKNINIIDYSNSRFCDDFLDVFLQSQCFFTISTSGGLDAITSAFRKPILFPCLFPIMDAKSSTSKHLVGCRHVISKVSKKKLTLNNILENNLGYIYSSSDLNDEDYYLADVDSNDIKQSAQEMIERLDGKYNLSAEDLELRKKFYQIFNKFSKHHPTDGQFHNEIKFEISINFLRKNIEWLN